MSIRQVLTLVFVLTLAVIGPYLITFHAGFSTVSDDWGAFGSYVGGTLGAAFALLAFLAAVQSILDFRRQQRLDGLLAVIRRCEEEFEVACAQVVTCKSPWASLAGPGDRPEVSRVSLRTLLYSHSVDWEQHLPPLITGNRYHILESGEVTQDREIVFQASRALAGIEEYSLLYKKGGGDASVVAYLEDRYKIPRYRLEAAAETTADYLAELESEDRRADQQE